MAMVNERKGIQSSKACTMNGRWKERHNGGRRGNSIIEGGEERRQYVLKNTCTVDGIKIKTHVSTVNNDKCKSIENQ